MFVALVALQLAAATPAISARDSARLRSRVEDREAAFIKQWRIEWGTDASLDGRPILLPEHYLKSPCPRMECPMWFPERYDPVHDEALGIDLGLSLGAQAVIKKARKPLLELMDSAALALPGDPWVAGQRVRMYVDQQDYAAAYDATTDCRADRWWCLALRGYVLHSSRLLARAATTFDSSLAVMPDSTRCRWNDLSFLFAVVGWNDLGLAPATYSTVGGAEATIASGYLDEGDRAYREATCAGRDSINATIWWLAQPLYLEPGNERKTDHYARRVIDDLHRGLETDERLDLREHYQGTRLTQMLVQWGWPAVFRWRGSIRMTKEPAICTGEEPTIDRNHPAKGALKEVPARLCNYIDHGGLYPLPSPQWLGPANHTIPAWHAINSPVNATVADWDLTPPLLNAKYWDDGWWPAELYHRRAGLLVNLPAPQIAFLRRGATTMIAAATDWDTTGLVHAAPKHPSFGIITSGSPTDSLRITKHDFLDEPLRGLLAPVDSRPLLLGIELMPSNGDGPAGRTRFGITPPAPLSALAPGQIALSDPILARAQQTDDAPKTVDETLARMFGSARLRNPKRIALFWEAYGLAPTDTLDMALRVIRTSSGGLFDRIASIFRGATDAVTIRWRESRLSETGASTDGGVTIHPQGTITDLSRLSPGDYVIELEMKRGTTLATARRAFSVIRP